MTPNPTTSATTNLSWVPHSRVRQATSHESLAELDAVATPPNLIHTPMQQVTDHGLAPLLPSEAELYAAMAPPPRTTGGEPQLSFPSSEVVQFTYESASTGELMRVSVDGDALPPGLSVPGWIHPGSVRPLSDTAFRYLKAELAARGLWKPKRVYSLDRRAAASSSSYFTRPVVPQKRAVSAGRAPRRRTRRRLRVRCEELEREMFAGR